jgi:hypothetical protein
LIRAHTPSQCFEFIFPFFIRINLVSLRFLCANSTDREFHK